LRFGFFCLPQGVFITTADNVEVNLLAQNTLGDHAHLLMGEPEIACAFELGNSMRVQLALLLANLKVPLGLNLGKVLPWSLGKVRSSRYFSKFSLAKMNSIMSLNFSLAGLFI
jgi:hypothetical protein